MSKRSKILIEVELDDNQVPEKLNWEAEDGGISNQKADAIFVSVWDGRTKDTLRIDLWTKEMTLDDMKRFIHQICLSLADTLQRATADEELADDMRKFSHYLAEKTGLIKSKKLE